MTLLGRFLLKHFVLYLLGIWVLFIATIFFLGVGELAMNRLGQAVEGGATSVFATAFRDRMRDLSQYASETMAYAGLVGFLLSFWSLWRRREFLQCQLLGGGNILWRNAMLAGLLFGTLQMTVVETWEHRRQDNDQVIRHDLQIVRNTAKGGRIMLFAERYHPREGLLRGIGSGGVRVLVFDEAFRVRSVLQAERGHIAPQAWILHDGIRIDTEGARNSFKTKKFFVETDLAALSYALQPDPYILPLWELPQAFRAARANARDSTPFVARAFFLLSLPLFYASFGFLAYALCLVLPHRTTGARMALFVILLPCGVEFVRRIAWSRVFADSLPLILPALGIPVAFACAAFFLVRNERLFS